MEPFLQDSTRFTHGYTFGGHPIGAAVALANIAVIEREDLNAHVRQNEGRFRAMLDSLRDIAIVGDVRGAGYFHAIELVKDRETRARFEASEAKALIHGFLGPKIFQGGLHCRCDDRGAAVIQLAPPLIAGPAEFGEIERILRAVLEEATQEFLSGGARGASDHATL
jgi:adenosylmethionine-8-amino-7-oxononanoate aminotransferase